MLYHGMWVLIACTALFAGVALGWMVKTRHFRSKIESSNNLSVRIIDEAKKEAETIKKEAMLQAKENLLKLKTEFERDTRDRKAELDGLEKRLRSKEESLDRRTDGLIQKELGIENREKALLQKESQLLEKHEDRKSTRLNSSHSLISFAW